MSDPEALWHHCQRKMLEARGELPADYVVIRAHPDLPDGFIPADLDGRWYDRSRMPFQPESGVPTGPFNAVAVPTGRFEIREYDGAVAEVYEFQP